jgi:uncharacterized membrane protein YfcA
VCSSDLGAFTRDSLVLSALLLPLALITTFVGAWVAGRLSGPRFYAIANGLLVLIGGRLLWEAFAGAA